MLTKGRLFVISLFLFFSASNASAAFITGSIGFTGSYQIWDDDTSMTVTDFNIGDTILVSDDTTVTGVVDGSFATAGITAGDAVTHNDIPYNPTGSINDIWSVGGFTMDINTMIVASIDTIDGNFITLTGDGSISSTNPSLETTPGTWIFSANTLGANLTWSSSSTVVPVPPAVWLFGSGLIGLVGIARRKNSV
jgi:hypothetical protein